jgi:hypothetical protein
LNVTEENQQPQLLEERVATRPGTGGVAEHRRRLYQRHLFIFIVVNGGLIAADQLTSPGMQWAHFFVFLWCLLFLLHTVGLKSRGFSWAELFVPPRAKPVAAVYTTPLDYELVRCRQLRDGVANAAAAIRDKHAAVADSAAAAADQLVAGLETLVTAARTKKYRPDEQAQTLLPEARAALEALDRLHQSLIGVEVLDESADQVPVEAVNERVESMRGLTR